MKAEFFRLVNIIVFEKPLFGTQFNYYNLETEKKSKVLSPCQSGVLIDGYIF